MVVEWKDASIYSKYDTEKVPYCWGVKFKSGLYIQLNQYHDEWVIKCSVIGISSLSIDAKTKEDAQKECVEIVKRKIKQYQDELNSFQK